MAETFEQSTKQGYPIIYRGTKAPVAFRGGAGDQYVVCHGYDVSTGEWGQGTYGDDLKCAISEADGRACENDRANGGRRYEIDLELLRSEAEALAFQGLPSPSLFERKQLADIMYYASEYAAYSNLFDDFVDAWDSGLSENQRELAWDSLDEESRHKLLAVTALHHSSADWDLVADEFQKRMEVCIEEDALDDPEFLLCD